MAIHRDEVDRPLYRRTAECSIANDSPRRKNKQRVMRIQRKGRFIFLEDLALEVDPRRGRTEFTVLNVFSFQNNFPVGLISNPIYFRLQIP